MQLLKDKVAIVTGSARGLGREFALRLVKEGAKVSLCDILDCSSVTKEIISLGGEVLAMKTDVTDAADTVLMAKNTVEQFGKIDIIVNNAALYGGIENKNFTKPFEQITEQEWDKMMSVNLKGIFLCCKAVVPYMKKSGQGKIINIASTVALAGVPLFLHYTTSKGGVIAMTKALARALGEYNINVNAIAPGLTWTEATKTAMTKEQGEAILSTQILKRLTQPEHITGTLVFLASSDADQITGQVIAVNAGEYI